jgi:hypothetical protein
MLQPERGMSCGHHNPRRLLLRLPQRDARLIQALFAYLIHDNPKHDLVNCPRMPLPPPPPPRPAFPHRPPRRLAGGVEALAVQTRIRRGAQLAAPIFPRAAQRGAAVRRLGRELHPAAPPAVIHVRQRCHLRYAIYPPSLRYGATSD